MINIIVYCTIHNNINIIHVDVIAILKLALYLIIFIIINYYLLAVYFD